jgi:hypothetical protein
MVRKTTPIKVVYGSKVRIKKRTSNAFFFLWMGLSSTRKNIPETTEINDETSIIQDVTVPDFDKKKYNLFYFCLLL